MDATSCLAAERHCGRSAVTLATGKASVGIGFGVGSTCHVGAMARLQGFSKIMGDKKMNKARTQVPWRTEKPLVCLDEQFESHDMP